MNALSKHTRKLPPQATDLEQAILGSLLINEEAINEVVDVITPEVFYTEKHQYIFRAISEMYAEGEQIDLLTVSDHLRKKKKLEKVGGDFYLIELSQKTYSSAHIDQHSRIILQKYIQRSLIKNSSAIIENCYDDGADVFNLLDSAYNHLNNVSEITIKPQEAAFSSIIRTQIEKGRKIYRGEIKAGISTPIKRLTQKSGGWRDKELVILAARPGMGKTAFALSSGIHSAKEEVPTAFFSLEMSKEQLTNRLLSMEGKIDGQKFTVHGLNNDDTSLLEAIEKKLKDIPLFIDDTPALSIEKFQIKAKKLKSKHGIKLIIVDYLQLMTSSGRKGGNREQEISSISRGLKKTAMDLGVPVIALSQLSRAVETRGGNKRPMLSDLRESGAIEQDADMVMFLYRPEYYGIDTWDDYEGVPTEGECEYLVSKNRNGGLIRNRMKFEAKYTLFSDLDDDNYEEEAPLPTPSFDDLTSDDTTPF